MAINGFLIICNLRDEFNSVNPPTKTSKNFEVSHMWP